MACETTTATGEFRKIEDYPETESNKASNITNEFNDIKSENLNYPQIDNLSFIQTKSKSWSEYHNNVKNDNSIYCTDIKPNKDDNQKSKSNTHLECILHNNKEEDACFPEEWMEERNKSSKEKYFEYYDDIKLTPKDDW